MKKITESDSNHHSLEEMTTDELLLNINKEDNSVPNIIKGHITKIGHLVNKIFTKLESGGRLFYLGAGTSGRLGILDASECPPTFGVSHDLVIGLIAGGDNAIRKAVEFAEDDSLLGWNDLISHNVNDKDIVIGMLQSLSQKEYPEDLFDCFGLSIYDETHHLGAEVFSRCMMRTITNYTLGLSGTMQRKDGLTKVFKMFLGDIVHKEKSNTSEHKVIVKAIHYSVEDPEFNEMKYDYRGNPLYSTMISKLCNYNHRSEFIIKVLQTELSKNNEQQIMILAHNKTLITYLFKAIEHRNIATVGYYIGGMKEEELKKSESKKVIIATYAMASEGLDIKSLTSLIMASPKTDVCQSVGRILRTKHTSPLVVDIIDSHDIFEKQWKKRKQYYIKQKYHIISSNMDDYVKDKWETLYDPLKSDECIKKIKKKEQPLKGVCLIKI